MTVTPSGILSEPLANLRAALSQCAAFQTWAGAANATEALESIALVEKDDLTRPFAVVDDGDAYSNERLDSAGTFRDQGSLFLLFEDAVAEENAASESDAILAFTNAIGAILEDLWEITPGVFDMRSLSKVFGPTRSDDKERVQGADYVQIAFRVQWGNG